MNNQPHRIQQQLITLDWVNTGEPHQLENLLTQFAKEQLLPQMESVFDRITRDGQVIKFDKIVIDLGDIHCSGSSGWQQAFCHRFITRLQEQLCQHSTEAKEPDRHTEESLQRAEIIFKQFLFFLNHGRLPWWGATREAAILRETVGLLTPVQWRKVRDAIDRNDQARSRLIVFCTDEQLEQCFTTAYALSHVAGMINFFVPIASDNTLYQPWRLYCWSRLFQVAAVKGQGTLVKEWLTQLCVLRAMPGTQAPGDRPVLKSSLQDGQLHQVIATLPEPWRTWLNSVLGSDLHWDATEQNTDHLLRRLVAGERFDTLIRIIPQAQQDVLPPGGTVPVAQPTMIPDQEKSTGSKALDSTVKAVANPVNVAAAGAVILHPFLQELFREQALLYDNDFRSEHCRHTAVHMIAYLAFGNLEIEEYDLLLPKLLCAMPWEQPLLPWELSDEQRKACDALLSATLYHWSALKSQSVDFLRQQFFWRNGKLKAVDGGWKLTIEKRAQDVLLDKLPWGVGVIRMAWMDEMLHVTWES